MPLIITGEGERGGDPLLKMLRKRVQKMGYTTVAEETGLAREALYRTLGDKGNPRLGTLVKLCQLFDLALSIRQKRKTCG